MAWSAPRTWVTGELVTAAVMNTHVRDQYNAIGEWAVGDLKMTWRTHANATTTTLTEPEVGWFIANAATFVAATYPLLNAQIGTNVLPDHRGRLFRAPGTQGGRAYARGNAGGAPTQTLGVANMPSHSHTVNSHSHGGVSQSMNRSNPHNHQMSGQLNFNNQDAGAGGDLIHIGNAALANTTQTTDINHEHGINGDTPGTNAQGSGSAFDQESPYIVGGMVLIKHD